MKTLSWPKRTVSPKAQKRMQEFKPSERRPQDPRPPRVLETMQDIEEAAFGKKRKK